MKLHKGRACAYCGSWFSNEPKVKTCSRECGYAYNRLRNAQKTTSSVPPGIIDKRRRGRHYDAPTIKSCIVCGALFAVSDGTKDHYSTCSRTCSSVRRSRIKRKHPDTEKSCLACGKKYVTRFNGNKLKREMYCSNTCRLKALNSIPRTKKKMYKYISRGYVRLVVNNPDGSQTHILEHRYVLEKKLGRRLRTNERIHHINGIKTDNRPENLMLFESQSEHMKYEFATGQRKRSERRS